MKYLFTITTGRSGTQFLTVLLRRNTDTRCYHERNLFNIHQPEISHMMTFNNAGNNKYIQDFWKRKAKMIQQEDTDFYVETSHILAKAGLIENLDLFDGFKYIVLLKRNPLEIVRSLHKRADFLNVGNMWLWWLHGSYRKNIIKPKKELCKQYQNHYMRVWYVQEMTERAKHYKSLLKNKDDVRVIEIDLEDLNNEKKTTNFLMSLDINTDRAEIPEPQNVQSHYLLPYTRLDEKIYKDLIDKELS